MTEKHNFIRVRGAREHNLKGVDLDIPREQLVVMTGLFLFVAVAVLVAVSADGVDVDTGPVVQDPVTSTKSKGLPLEAKKKIGHIHLLPPPNKKPGNKISREACMGKPHW